MELGGSFYSISRIVPDSIVPSMPATILSCTLPNSFCFFILNSPPCFFNNTRCPCNSMRYLHYNIRPEFWILSLRNNFLDLPARHIRFSTLTSYHITREEHRPLLRQRGAVYILLPHRRILGNLRYTQPNLHSSHTRFLLTRCKYQRHFTENQY